MWWIFLISMLLALVPASLRAQENWEVCQGKAGASAPVLEQCQPAGDVIDPQGREMWLRATVRRPVDDQVSAFYVVGVVSSEVWLNGHKLGANGQPGHSKAMEIAGRYEAAFPIPDRFWQAGDNAVVVRMSSFHGTVRLDSPVAGMVVAPYPWPTRPAFLAIVFAIAGTLFAAAIGFGLIYSLRRTGSSLALAAMAGVASLQAVLESLRALVPYAYPVHGLRLVGIWVLTVIFAVLLVSYVVSRFWPQARRPLIAIALSMVGLTFFASGYDLKTLLALMVGLILSAVVTGVAAYRRMSGARAMLAYLGTFIAVGLIFPSWLVDLSYFLFVAGLVLPLLMADLMRLGRDVQQREVVLTRAAARPNCLTVASSRGVERVPLDEIVAVVGADDYVELRLTRGRKLLHSARLDRLETELPENFARVHRSVIANLAHVRGLERDGGRNRLLVNEGEPLSISRNRLPAVREMLSAGNLPH